MSPLLLIPVPWVFVLTYLLGVLVQRFVPLTMNAPSILISHIAGIVFMTIGVPLAVWSLGIFRTVGTTTVPFETSSKLVTWGPYRFSRNPMYVSLTLIYLGVAGIQAHLWPLLLLPLALAHVRWSVIPLEEKQLLEAFGGAYELYLAKVRRWL